MGLHWCLSPAIVAPEEIGPDGHPEKGGFLPPIALPRRMWAGGQVELYAPIEVGDEVQKLSQIKDVNFKQGRSGPLAFVTVVHRFSTSRGLAVKERHDIVYREASSSGVGGKSDPGTVPAEGDSIAVDDVTLFRYSALTFNGHRIHYDRRYVTEVEGYPGLIVHGPLIATLLVDLVRRHSPAQWISGFQFKAVRPTFDLNPFRVNARPQADGRTIDVWANDHDGYLTMTGTVTLENNAS